MTIPVTLSWLFLTLCIYSSLSGHVVLAGQCLRHQQSLLLQLKHALIFDETLSQNLVNWNESFDCCTWPGITCDDEGRVTGLKLSNESISDGIHDNSTLFNLVHLKSLDLSYNLDLYSKIPSMIGNLTNLNYLNLSYSFSGQIPKTISLLNKLLILDLSTSNVWQCGLNSNLSMMFKNLTRLEELYLDSVNISASGNEWGQALSSSLPNLRVLSLTGCSLSGPIDKSLAKLQHLSVIQLDYNYLLSSKVPKFFANFSNLTSLSLSACNLYGMFPKEIFQVPTLRILDISENELLGGSLPEFPPHSDLQTLVLFDTNFKGRIPASIGNLGQLSRLEIEYCHFNGSLPKSMTNLTQLIHLDLSSNFFTGPIPTFNMSYNLTGIYLSHNGFNGPIPSFTMSKNLIEIDLSNNCFSGPIPSAHWEGLLYLVYVDLHNNSLNGNIPSSLFALPSLEEIDLSNNQFSGVDEFPNPTSSMLYSIDFSRNKLQGTIPLSIFKLRELEFLSLSSNKFNGTIDLDMILHHTNVYDLDLSYNDLSIISASVNNPNFSFVPRLKYLSLTSCKLGVFPYLSNNLDLYNLDLSNNQISGEIPNWIWKVGSDLDLNLSHNQLVGMQEPYSLQNLSTLDLSFNQLHGKIPILPAHAYYIDLSSNNFTSSIPFDIGNNLSAHYVSLSNNGLTGVIPESICNMSNLEVLDLSNNSLNGKIPTCIFAMNLIFGVNLQRNNLNGPIPDAFPVNCNLRTLDLNGNLLIDRIPKSLANCNALEVLNLGNNQMLDTFPLLLKNISTLRVIVLKSNKLHGSITCDDNIGAWPVIEIVDVASNNFSGELPFQCLTTWHAMMMVKDDVQSPFIVPSPYPEEEGGQGLSYKDVITVTNKRLEMELVKIPKGFTCIDFSSNNFHGVIPKELGLLKNLMVLNLSNNALKGHIPSSFGNLHQLESLDLSRNHLNGEIPASLSNLNFLQVLDLSHNQLSGRIPKGTQIQTFSADCFQSNLGLCGPPLTPNCKNDAVDRLLPKTSHEAATHPNSGNTEIKWDLISAEVGFVVGFGGVIGPLVFCCRWRKRYYDHVEDIAFRILPNLLLEKWLSWKMGM